MNTTLFDYAEAAMKLCWDTPEYYTAVGSSPIHMDTLLLLIKLKN